MSKFRNILIVAIVALLAMSMAIPATANHGQLDHKVTRQELSTRNDASKAAVTNAHVKVRTLGLNSMRPWLRDAIKNGRKNCAVGQTEVELNVLTFDEDYTSADYSNDSTADREDNTELKTIKACVPTAP